MLAATSIGTRRGRAALGLRLGCIALALALAGATAEAKKKKKSKVADEVIDISAAKASMVVLSDGDGAFLAVAPEAPDSSDLVFYSENGKDFYQLRVRGGGSDGTTGRWDRSFWSPRVFQASVMRKPFKAGETPSWTVSCQMTWEDEDEDAYTQLPAEDGEKIIEKATFRPQLWQRQAYYLARDDMGNYYFVDRHRDENGGKGYRLFRGPKGNMKEMPMTNIVSDSVGEIFTTKKGELRLVVNATQAKWVYGEKSMELTPVPVEDNLVLIYSDLGVYLGSLGTPCDDH